MRVRLVLPAVLLLAGCATHDGAVGAEQELMQTSRSWARAAAGGNLEELLSYWTEDAIVLPPDQPAVVGKAAIREFVQQSAAIPGFSITWEPEHAAIAASGDVGYLVEHNQVTFTDSTGTTRTQFGKAVTIWKRDASGAWKCAVDTWNNNPTARVLAWR